MERAISSLNTSAINYNEDCLISICRYLSPIDLAFFASANTDFLAAAQKAFVLKESNKHVDILQLFRPGEPAWMERMHRHFQCFGKLFKEINMCYRVIVGNIYQSGWNVPNDVITECVMDNLAKYCTNGILEVCHLEHIEFEHHPSNEIVKIFSGLKKMHLEHCQKITKVLEVSQECSHVY